MINPKDDIKNSKEKTIEYVKILAEYGWTLPMKQTPTETFKILLENRDKDKIDSYFLEYYTKEDNRKFEQMIKEINMKIDTGCKELFEQCVKAFQQNTFLIIVPSLIAIIERNIARISDSNEIRVIRLTKEIVEKSDEKMILILGWISVEKFIEKLYEKSDFAKEFPRQLNRHWIVHGRGKMDWNKSDALKLFHALQTILLSERIVVR